MCSSDLTPPTTQAHGQTAQTESTSEIAPSSVDQASVNLNQGLEKGLHPEPTTPTPVTSILFLQSYQQEVYQQAWFNPMNLLSRWYRTDTTPGAFVTVQVPDSGDDQ